MFPLPYVLNLSTPQASTGSYFAKTYWAGLYFAPDYWCGTGTVVTAGTFRQAIYAGLADNPSISLLVAAVVNNASTLQIRPGRIAQNDSLANGPAVTYRIFGTQQINTLSGGGGTVDRRVEITAHATKQSVAEALAIAIRNTFDGLTNATINGVFILESWRDDERDETEYADDGTDTSIYRITQDYFFKYRESSPR